MLFLTYWELNEDMHVEKRLQVAQKLAATGSCPPKGFKTICWDATPDGWGFFWRRQTAPPLLARPSTSGGRPQPGFSSLPGPRLLSPSRRICAGRS